MLDGDAPDMQLPSENVAGHTHRRWQQSHTAYSGIKELGSFSTKLNHSNQEGDRLEAGENNTSGSS